MVEFIPVDLRAHRSILTELNEEYFGWVAHEFSEKSKIDIFSILNETVQEYAEKSVAEIESYVPPKGLCYLVQVDGGIAGMGVLRRLHSRIGEVKRMFIRPEFRRKGLGKALLE
ncbi:MAG: GNAT family N-acetyltransferase, partial [Candidatus Thorarchaeota archaeon]